MPPTDGQKLFVKNIPLAKVHCSRGLLGNLDSGVKFHRDDCHGQHRLAHAGCRTLGQLSPKFGGQKRSPNTSLPPMGGN